MNHKIGLKLIGNVKYKHRDAHVLVCAVGVFCGIIKHVFPILFINSIS